MVITKKILFLLFLVLLQVTWFSRFTFHGVAPDLLFVGIMVLCLRTEATSNLPYALCCGLYLDSKFAQPFFLHSVLFLLLPLLLHVLEQVVYTSRLLLGMIAVLLGSIAYYLVSYIIFVPTLTQVSFERYYNQLFLPIMFVNVAAFIVLYLATAPLFRTPADGKIDNLPLAA